MVFELNGTGKSSFGFTAKSKNGIQDILSRAQPANCHPQEKEILVDNRNVKNVMGKLRAGGFRLIGKSTPDLVPKGKTKLWFIRGGPIL